MSKSVLETDVILLRERLGESIAKDLVSIGTLTGGVYVGVLLESSAMQWVAGLLWLFFTFSRAMRIGKENRLTISQARKRLDEIEAQMGETKGAMK